MDATDDPAGRILPTPRRRFTLLDGLILMVPIALAFALVRDFLKNDVNAGGMARSPKRTEFFGRHLLGRVASMATLGVLAVRLRRPRPPRRRLGRQPGFVACVAGAAAMAVSGAIYLPPQAFRTSWNNANNRFWPDFDGRIGPAVVAAWVALAWTGRWRSEPTWIDRAGRFVGVCWVFLAFLPWVSGLIIPWLPPL